MSKTLIEALGGTGEVATLLGQNASTVSNWKERGVPWKFRHQMVNLAKARRVEVPDGFLSPS